MVTDPTPSPTPSEENENFRLGLCDCHAGYHYFTDHRNCINWLPDDHPSDELLTAIRHDEIECARCGAIYPDTLTHECDARGSGSVVQELASAAADLVRSVDQISADRVMVRRSKRVRLALNEWIKSQGAQ